ncbi:unnamed protein product, partial [Oikopleura dioica]
MGHAQSKRKKRSQARLRRKIEHVTHEQTRAGASGNARLPDRKSVQKSARWREPSPEKLETLERRKRDAANRTKRSRSRSEQSRSRSPKRQSRALMISMSEIIFPWASGHNPCLHFFTYTYNSLITREGKNMKTR